MPIVIQEHFTRSDLRANPRRLYVFGDNELRKGLKGQAAECRGEPNAVGVATKRAPGRNPDDFWSDRERDRLIAVIDRDFTPLERHLAAGSIVVFPKAGLGTGLAQLPTKAPAVFKHLSDRIADLATTYGLVSHESASAPMRQASAVKPIA